MTLETIVLSDAMRIVVEPDYCAQNPRLDYREGSLFYARPRARMNYLSPDGEPAELEDAWDRLRDRYTADTSYADILSWFLPDMEEGEEIWSDVIVSIRELRCSLGATEPRWDAHEAEFLGIDVEVVE